MSNWRVVINLTPVMGITDGISDTCLSQIQVRILSWLLKIKRMKKTYNNGILVGTIITSIIYSILLFVIVYNLTH